MEVPEIMNEQVEIKAIARFSGIRSKVAVASNQEGLDPQGACIGQRGMRINAIMNELGDEKVDIVKWDLDIQEFIKNSLSPANVLRVIYDHDRKTATAIVPEDQLSLAIGREGTNVRLASVLTDLEISVVSESEMPAVVKKEEKATPVKKAVVEKKVVAPKRKAIVKKVATVKKPAIEKKVATPKKVVKKAAK
jgi:N utilization substance protein A